MYKLLIGKIINDIMKLEKEDITLYPTIPSKEDLLKNWFLCKLNHNQECGKKQWHILLIKEEIQGKVLQVNSLKCQFRIAKAHHPKCLLEAQDLDSKNV